MVRLLSGRFEECERQGWNLKVFLGIPSYDRKLHWKLFEALLGGKREVPVRPFLYGSSLPTYGFNMIWAEALNARAHGFTHFAMVHTDISPELGFVDKLIDIMQRHEADVVSAVVPIKTAEGLTSTALESVHPFQPKRFTMKEIFQREPTFTDPHLLLNTGCMLVDFRKPWVEEIVFHYENIIGRMESGAFGAMSFPEDWHFSRQARKLGARLFATREVRLTHWGEAPFENAEPWGTCETDPKCTFPLLGVEAACPAT